MQVAATTTATPNDPEGLRSRIALLEQENRWLKSQLFGRSSEKSRPEEQHPDQARLFDEAEALANQSAPEHVTIPAHERKKRGRKKLDAALPRVEVVHDIPDEHKHCAADGTALVRIGEEVSEQLDYQPARMRVIRHIRPQYACPCCRQGVHIAPMPEQLLPKSLATPSLLAHIVTAKFVDHLPLYRQERQFERLGVTLGRATMAGWMIRLGQAVQPLINLLGEQMLAAGLIHCDETQLQVLRSEKASTDHWIWVRCAGPPRRPGAAHPHPVIGADLLAPEHLQLRLIAMDQRGGEHLLAQQVYQRLHGLPKPDHPAGHRGPAKRDAQPLELPLLAVQRQVIHEIGGDELRPP